jgi:hypothetical protein
MGEGEECGLRFVPCSLPSPMWGPHSSSWQEWGRVHGEGRGEVWMIVLHLMTN